MKVGFRPKSIGYWVLKMFIYNELMIKMENCLPIYYAIFENLKFLL